MLVVVAVVEMFQVVEAAVLGVLVVEVQVKVRLLVQELQEQIILVVAVVVEVVLLQQELMVVLELLL